jgi:hypothetical protein
MVERVEAPPAQLDDPPCATVRVIAGPCRDPAYERDGYALVIEDHPRVGAAGGKRQPDECRDRERHRYPEESSHHVAHPAADSTRPALAASARTPTSTSENYAAFSATNSILRTRPVPSHSLQSR